MKSDFFLINPIKTGIELKELLFQGYIFLFTQINSAKMFAEFALSFLQRELNVLNIKDLEKNVSEDIFFKTFSKLKKKFSSDYQTQIHIQNILKEMKFNLHSNFFDVARLRCVTSYAHKIIAAKPAFAIHRDTWYANSESQINWWIPIFNVNELDTFSFYPNYFSKPIKNNSSEFNYEEWQENGGFQSTEKSKLQVFPEAKEKINIEEEFKIPCDAGNLLLFSASHLHGTKPNLTQETRFSLDFRTVDLDDLDFRSAPNVDNESKGSILVDMLSALSFNKFGQ